MGIDNDELRVQLIAVVDDYIANLKQAGVVTQDAASDIESSLRRVQDQMRTTAQEAGKMSEASSSAGVEGKLTFIAMAEAAKGVIEIIAGIKDKMVELGEKALETRNMAEVLEVTTDQYQVMAEAAEQAGVGASRLLMATERLTTSMAEAREGNSTAIGKMRELGFSFEQIQDKTFGTNDILMVLHDRLNDASTATETLSMLKRELGTRAALVAIALKEYDGSVAGVNEKMKELHGWTAAENTQLANAKLYWHDVGQEIDNVIGRLLLLTTAVARSGGSFVKSIIPGLGGVAGLWDKPEAKAAEAAKPGSGGASDPSIVTELQLKAVKDQTRIYKEGTEQRIYLDEAYLALVKQRYGEGSDKAIEAQAELTAAELAFSEKRKSNTEKEVKAKGTAWAAFEKDWERMHDNAVKADAKHNQDIQNLTAAMQASADTTLAEQAKWARETIAITETEAQQRIASVKNVSDLTMQQAQRDLDAGRITAKQKLLIEAQLQDGLYNEELRGAQERLSLAMAAGDPTKVAEAAAKVQVVIEQHTLKVSSLMTQAAKLSQSSFNQLFTNIGSGMTSAVMGFLQGTQSLAQGVRNMMMSVVSAGIEMLAKLAVEWARVHIMKMVMAKQETVAASGTAAVEGAASAAKIPFVGWAIAIGAAAAIFAAMSQYSAAGGMDIPSGVNPVVQTHAREMILPANLSDGLRDIIANGGGQGGGGVNINVQAHDASGFQQLLMQHGDTLVRAIKRHVRNGGVSLGE